MYFLSFLNLLLMQELYNNYFYLLLLKNTKY